VSVIPGDMYDEVGSRTRQSWLRTSLVVVAVTLLVMRSFFLAEVPHWIIVVSMLPAIGFLVLSVRRTMTLNHADSVGAAHRVAVGVAVSVAALIVFAVLGVLLG
jgi:hypothetical protein